MKTGRVVVFTGAGVSRASGLATFRDPDGIWNRYKVEEVATSHAWCVNPRKVLDFYNLRRREAALAQPNPAHLAMARLQEKYSVTVVTQNVDDLHERAGSKEVLHLHGELRKSRSTVDPDWIIEQGMTPIRMGDLCPNGGQMRPHIVWFGEPILLYEEAVQAIMTADRLMVAGTSLQVYPAAGLLAFARHDAIKVLVDPDPAEIPNSFTFVRGSAENMIPPLVESWLEEA